MSVAYSACRRRSCDGSTIVSPAPDRELRFLISDQHLVNRRKTEGQMMKSNQLVSEAFDPKTALTT